MSRPRALLASWPGVRRRLCRAPAILLLADYDGTLSPIASRPERAVLPARTRAVLKRLARLPTVLVGVISGRALRDVKRQVRLSGLLYVGNHGLELAGGGLRFRHPKATAFRATLRRLTRRLEGALRKIQGAWIEQKSLTASLHWRAVAPVARPRLHRLVRELVEPAVKQRRLRVTAGTCVTELRPPFSWDKGKSIAWLLERVSRRDGTRPLVIYLGDDRTDEDAFREVNRVNGVSVVVGRPPHRTMAQFWVGDPQAICQWLTMVHETLAADREEIRRPPYRRRQTTGGE